jgi:protein SCO1/2
MQKYIKAGMLTLVLALPAFLILFLHSFGENHFELPYFVPAVDSTGQTILNGKDTVFYQVPLKKQNSIRVVGFFEPLNDIVVAQHFSRVEKLIGKEVIFEVVRDNPISLGQIYKVGNLKNVKSNQTIPYNEEFVLLDKQGYIRGFYDGKDEKEVERLITEINVLLDIYQKNKD